MQARNGVCRVNRVRGGRGAWTARTVDPIRNTSLRLTLSSAISNTDGLRGGPVGTGPRLAPTKPFIFYFSLTRLCDLVVAHC